MKRIDAAHHDGNLFQTGNPLTSQRGTRLDHTWLNAVQEEIAGVIEKAGLTLDEADNTQLFKALFRLSASYATHALAQDAAVAGIAPVGTIIRAVNFEAPGDGGGYIGIVELAEKAGHIGDGRIRLLQRASIRDVPAFFGLGLPETAFEAGERVVVGNGRVYEAVRNYAPMVRGTPGANFHKADNAPHVTVAGGAGFRVLPGPTGYLADQFGPEKNDTTAERAFRVWAELNSRRRSKLPFGPYALPSADFNRRLVFQGLWYMYAPREMLVFNQGGAVLDFEDATFLCHFSDGVMMWLRRRDEPFPADWGGDRGLGENETLFDISVLGGQFHNASGSQGNTTAIRLYAGRNVSFDRCKWVGFGTGLSVQGKDTIHVRDGYFNGNRIGVHAPPNLVSTRPDVLLMLDLDGTHFVGSGVDCHVLIEDRFIGCSVEKCSFNSDVAPGFGQVTVDNRNDNPAPGEARIFRYCGNHTEGAVQPALIIRSNPTNRITKPRKMQGVVIEGNDFNNNSGLAGIVQIANATDVWVGANTWNASGAQKTRILSITESSRIRLLDAQTLRGGTVEGFANLGTLVYPVYIDEIDEIEVVGRQALTPRHQELFVNGVYSSGTAHVIDFGALAKDLGRSLIRPREVTVSLAASQPNSAEGGGQHLVALHSTGNPALRSGIVVDLDGIPNRKTRGVEGRLLLDSQLRATLTVRGGSRATVTAILKGLH